MNSEATTVDRHLEPDRPWLIDALPKDIEVIELRPGTRVFREGASDDDFYVVLAGTIKLSRKSIAGHEVLIGLRGPTDHFGHVAAFDPAPRAVTAKALTSAQVARIPQSVLVPWLLRHPEASLELLRSVARRVRRNNSVLSDMLELKVSSRVAKQLLGLANDLGRPSDAGLLVDHQLSQTELAHLAGTSRETCNKVLAELARSGCLRVESRSIIVTDLGRLQSAARATSNA
jgi:CRP/FNR family cyclic AMP-dependent transcriptional regulator